MSALAPTTAPTAPGGFVRAVVDARTMVRRNIRRIVRYPSLTIFLFGGPVLILLMSVYVFGGTLGAGLPDVGRTGRGAYTDYVVPGLLVVTIAGVAQGTAIAVAMDMTQGVVDRFRAMHVTRGAVLTGHALAALLQTLIALAVVLAVALLVGFRPTAGVLGWLGALGVLVLTTVAVTWISAALGLAAKSVETASNTPMFLLLLPFLGSGFVPTESMPFALRLFADHQPFTPIIETVRGLLFGTPVGWSAVAAVAWCVVLTVGGYLWAVRLYDKER